MSHQYQQAQYSDNAGGGGGGYGNSYGNNYGGGYSDEPQGGNYANNNYGGQTGGGNCKHTSRVLYLDQR
ncbi:uncharacterized protein IL334_001077 [Kwoniella shivajii]|uniref:Uncharacterized protein n=1 Tax=Kwoniella shivajii TaxID=564305 RepID=A0ABZ1CQX7_9TREE|nr:hypothetical protein IL334_001077 [Kwoniella shivajii]